MGGFCPRPPICYGKDTDLFVMRKDNDLFVMRKDNDLFVRGKTMTYLLWEKY